MRTRPFLVAAFLVVLLVGSLPFAPAPVAWSAERAQATSDVSWWSSPDEAAMQVLSIRTDTVVVKIAGRSTRRSALTGAASELRIAILFRGERRELTGYEAVAYLLVRDYLTVTKVNGRTRLVATDKLVAWTKAHPMTGGTSASIAPTTTPTTVAPSGTGSPASGARWELATIYQGFQTPTHRSTFLGGNNIVSPSASASGGQITMSYWASSNCLQTVTFTWTFDRSLSSLRKGDKLGIRFKAEYGSGNCNDRRVASIGLTGESQFESVPTDVWGKRAFLGGDPEAVGVLSGSEQNEKVRSVDIWIDPKAGSSAFFQIAAGVPVNGSPYDVAYYFRAVGV